MIIYPIRYDIRIYNQPDDGLEKRSKHVVVPKICYMNKAP